MAMRPSSRISRNWANPRPCLPSRCSSGTRHSTNVRPWVSEACQPILRYGGCTSKPGVPAGTTIVEISPGPVSAVTVTSDVIGVPEFVMNDFSPSITHCPAVSSSRALVRVPPASLPASGSVSPKPPSVRPAHRSGSQRSCCSGVPNLWIGLAPSPTPASSVIASDWSARAISSIATHSPVRSPPPP